MTLAVVFFVFGICTGTVFALFGPRIDAYYRRRGTDPGGWFFGLPARTRGWVMIVSGFGSLAGLAYFRWH